MNRDTRTLTASQWAVMHALELGNLDLETIQKDVRILEGFGLLEFVDGIWRPTLEGRTLVALRRQI